MTTYTGSDGLTYDYTDTVLTISGSGACTSLSNGYLTLSDSTRVSITGSTKFVIGASITKMSTSSSPFESSAVYGCSSLAEIDVESGNAQFKSVDGVLYSLDGAYLYNYPQAKAGDSYTTPSGVVYVTSSAFRRCRYLKSIHISGAVTSLGLPYAIDGSVVEEIIIDESNTRYASVDGVVFSKNLSELLTYPPRKQGSEYTIPSTVTKLAYYAFNYCIYLESVYMPDSVVDNSAGGSEFALCTNLKEVRLSQSLTIIPSYMFYNCSSLTSISIPAGITRISNGAFYNSYNLKNIFFEGTKVSTIESAAFALKASNSLPALYTNVYSPGNCMDGALDAYKNNSQYVIFTYRSLPHVSMSVKVSGEWKDGTPWVKASCAPHDDLGDYTNTQLRQYTNSQISGGLDGTLPAQWIKARAAFVKVNGEWKESK